MNTVWLVRPKLWQVQCIWLAATFIICMVAIVRVDRAIEAEIRYLIVVVWLVVSISVILDIWIESSVTRFLPGTLAAVGRLYKHEKSRRREPLSGAAWHVSSLLLAAVLLVLLFAFLEGLMMSDGWFEPSPSMASVESEGPPLGQFPPEMAGPRSIYEQAVSGGLKNRNLILLALVLAEIIFFAEACARWFKRQELEAILEWIEAKPKHDDPDNDALEFARFRAQELVAQLGLPVPIRALPFADAPAGYP